MPNTVYYRQLAQKRKARVRAKIHGTSQRPRLTIFRSNKHTYIQVIDDQQARTVASASSKSLAKVTGTKVAVAQQVAAELLTQLQKQGITAVVLDRGAARYHGRIRAITEALREGKIKV